MKIQNFFLAILLVFLAIPISAQEKKDETGNKIYESGEQLMLRRNIFKLTPGDFFNSTFTVGLESMNKSYTRSLNLHLNIRSGQTWEGDIFGIGGEISYRFYTGRGLVIQEGRRKNRFIQGVYFAPYLRGGYLTSTEQTGQQVYDPTTNTWNWQEVNRETDITYIFPGVYVGWQRTFWDLLYMDVFVGGGVRMTKVERNIPLPNNDYWSDGILDLEYNGVAPRLGINLGISF